MILLCERCLQFDAQGLVSSWTSPLNPRPCYVGWPQDKVACKVSTNTSWYCKWVRSCRNVCRTCWLFLSTSAKKILLMSSKISEIDGSSFSQNPRRLHCLRNPSNRARSAAEQLPDHTGEEYWILPRIIDRKTSCSDTEGRPWAAWVFSTQKAYSRRLLDSSRLDTWSDALSLSLTITPSTLRLDTRSLLRHRAGGWADFPRTPRALKMISFDVVRLSFRIVSE